jgi:hypothetical protein
MVAGAQAQQQFIANTSQTGQDVYDAAKGGNIPLAALRLGGGLVGMVGNAANIPLQMGTAVLHNIPGVDQASNWLSQKAVQPTMQAIGNLPVGPTTLQGPPEGPLVPQGTSLSQLYQNMSPENQRDIGYALNVGSLGLPLAGRGVAEAVGGVGKAIESSAVKAQLQDVADMATKIPQKFLKKFNGADDIEKRQQFTATVQNNGLQDLIPNPKQLADVAGNKANALIDGATAKLSTYAGENPNIVVNPVAEIKSIYGDPSDPMSGAYKTTIADAGQPVTEALANPGAEERTAHKAYVDFLSSPAIQKFNLPMTVDKLADFKKAINPTGDLFSRASDDVATTVYDNLRQNIYHDIIDKISEFVPEAQADLTKSKNLINVQNAATAIAASGEKASVQQKGILNKIISGVLPTGGLALGGGLLGADALGHALGATSGGALGFGVDLARKNILTAPNMATFGRGLQNVGGAGVDLANAMGANIPGQMINSGGQALNNLKFQNRPGSIGGALSPDEIVAQSQALKGGAGPAIPQSVVPSTRLLPTSTDYPSGAILHTEDIKNIINKGQSLPSNAIIPDSYFSRSGDSPLHFGKNTRINGYLDVNDRPGEVIISPGTQMEALNADNANLSSIPANMGLDGGALKYLSIANTDVKVMPPGTKVSGYASIAGTKIKQLPPDFEAELLDMRNTKNIDIPDGVQKVIVDRGFFNRVPDDKVLNYINDIDKMVTKYPGTIDNHLIEEYQTRIDKVRNNIEGISPSIEPPKTLTEEDADNRLVEGAIEGNTIIDGSINPGRPGPLYNGQLKMGDNIHIKGNLTIPQILMQKIPNNITVDFVTDISWSKITNIGRNFKSDQLRAAWSDLKALPTDMQVRNLVDISNTQINKIPSNLKTNTLNISGSKVTSLPPNLQVGYVFAQQMPSNFTVPTLSSRITHLVISKSDLPNLLNNIPDSNIPLWIDDIKKVSIGNSNEFDDVVQDAYADRWARINPNNMKGNTALKMLLGMSGASAAGLAAPKIAKTIGNLINNQGTPVSQLKKE